MRPIDPHTAALAGRILCGSCNRPRATTVVTVTENEQTTERILCPECAGTFRGAWLTGEPASGSSISVRER